MSTHPTRWPVMLVAVAIATSAAGAAFAQTTHAIAPNTPDGAQLYRTYCASCHGTSARGDGPLADALRRRPSDLTEIRRRHGGFPEDVITRIIDGRQPVRGHGSIEMPVWGDAFRSGERTDDETIRQRILALVRYLEAIQARNTN